MGHQTEARQRVVRMKMCDERAKTPIHEEQTLIVFGCVLVFVW